MRDLKQTGFTDRLTAQQEAKKALLARFKPKAAAPDPEFDKLAGQLPQDKATALLPADLLDRYGFSADGQRVFDFTYDATGPGAASEFYVFVVVDLLPLDLLSLELAQATAPPSRSTVTMVVAQERSSSRSWLMSRIVLGLAAMRSSSGGCVMNRRLRPIAPPPAMPNIIGLASSSSSGLASTGGSTTGGATATTGAAGLTGAGLAGAGGSLTCGAAASG